MNYGSIIDKKWAVAWLLVLVGVAALLFYRFWVPDETYLAHHISLSEPGRRVLVIAPHPDDESLAAAGVIMRCLERKGEVRVVVVTSGDHFLKAARILTGKRRVGPADLAYLARVRERETLSAMRVLGLEKGDVLFLKYPDTRILTYWRGYKRGAISGGPGAVLEGELIKQVLAFRPTDIYYPSAFDEHPDHRGVSRFVECALNTTGLPVRRHLYLVHYDKNRWPYFPFFYRHLPLTPPVELSNRTWEVFSLKNSELQRKFQAINCYGSQLKAMGGRYLIYARPEELFLEEGSQGVVDGVAWGAFPRFNTAAEKWGSNLVRKWL